MRFLSNRFFLGSFAHIVKLFPVLLTPYPVDSSPTLVPDASVFFQRVPRPRAANTQPASCLYTASSLIVSELSDVARHIFEEILILLLFTILKAQKGFLSVDGAPYSVLQQVVTYGIREQIQVAVL
jgi:hypothetical protein